MSAKLVIHEGRTIRNLVHVADSWLGCDKVLPLKLKVNELTRAEREGRTHRGKQLKPADSDAESDAAADNEDDDDDEEDEEGESPIHFLLLTHIKSTLSSFAIHLR